MNFEKNKDIKETIQIGKTNPFSRLYPQHLVSILPQIIEEPTIPSNIIKNNPFNYILHPKYVDPVLIKVAKDLNKFKKYYEDPDFLDLKDSMTIAGEFENIMGYNVLWEMKLVLKDKGYDENYKILEDDTYEF